MSSKIVPDAMRQHSFKAALSSGSTVSRKLRRSRQKRLRSARLPGAAPIAAFSPAPAQPDPVQIAVLAMERLGRASMRASFTGIEVRVTAPDDTIAAIFRAALAETVRNRPTDRLVRVVVD